MAESRGISMVGNSWYVLQPLHFLKTRFLIDWARIYKSKYKEDSDAKQASDTSPEKKSTGRSRARSMFGRKRPPQPA